jgi:phosphonate transport system substrate-binding protein
MSLRGPVISLLCLIASIATPGSHAEEHLVMGVFPRFNATETTTRYTPVAEYLGERLGRKVVLVTSKDFESFWKGVTEQRYDIVQYNQYHYIRSSRDYQVIAHNKEFGKSTIAGAIYVRKDSGITSLAQLRGRSVMFGGGEDAMMSYIAPVYMMLQAGLRKDDFKTVFAVNPINAILALQVKQADAAGSGDIVMDQPAVKNAINADEITALAVSEPLLHLPWAVKRSMSPKLRASIQSILLNIENQGEPGKKVLKSALITGVGKADDKDYDPHRKMIASVFGPERVAR